MRELVLIHGRAQGGKDATALKAEWVQTWREGLRAQHLDVPIPESAIRFPFYGDTLDDLVGGKPPGEVAEIIVRGDGAADLQKKFVRDVLQETAERFGITDADLKEIVDAQVVEQGPLNWRWVQAVLTFLDRKVPRASGAAVAVATADVWHYLSNAGVRDRIDTGVRAAITPGVPTVVVGHSLGSVVAYSLLRRDGGVAGWTVPLFLTVGSPLGVTAVRHAFEPLKHPSCVGKWFNAMDDRDVVALYPLTAANFPVTPEIENKTDVDNQTENRHGIAGYLNDPTVAKRIYDALVS